MNEQSATGMDSPASGVFDDIPESIGVIVAENVDLKEELYAAYEIADQLRAELAAARRDLAASEGW
jgi:hypothetical protein